MEKNSRILEALKMQPLSEEEKSKRHILGRLYGPIATCVKSTRNGRRYSKELWEKALADDIFKEKVANKSLFLELGHPADREETDMTCVCACIPELPKIVDGDLYAYVDILDTPNGKLLKTLCDYGFVPGISSRGSGDVMPNDEVDPETFFLETWDIVQLPAVKEARLSVCESLEPQKAALTKALVESYKGKTKEEQKVMEEALDNLNLDVDLTEAHGKKSHKKDDASYFMGGTPKNIKDIPWEELPKKFDTALTEDEDIDEVPEVTEDGKVDLQTAGDVIDLLSDYDKDASLDIAPVVVDGEEHEISNIDINPTEDGNIMLTVDVEETPAEEAPVEEKLVEEVSEESTEEAAEEVEAEADEAAETEAEAEVEITTVKDLLDLLGEADKEAEVIFNPIVIDGKEYDDLEYSVNFDKDAKKVYIDITCPDVEDDSAKEDEADVELEQSKEDADAEEAEEIKSEEDKAEDEAIDDGLANVLEQLKDLVRSKELLESEIKSLRQSKTVSDTKVEKLNSELSRYKESFERTSAIAAKATRLSKQVEKLTEAVEIKDGQLFDLRAKYAKASKLSESLKTRTEENAQLTENLKAVKTEADEKINSLTEQLDASKKLVEQRTGIAKRYKDRYEAVLTHYVDSKARMLGVPSSEILGKLTENYTVEDVDTVCDELLTSTVNINSLPFNTRSHARVVESSRAPARKAPANTLESGYEIDDSLLQLAGLKD